MRIAALALMTALAALPAASLPAPAQTPAQPAASPASLQDLPDARAAIAYLNNLKTLKARFIQTDNNGRQMTGDFMLKRPGRMRFQYDAPVTDFIVADGIFVHYYDGQMKQQSSAPIGRSLANFFLRDTITLDGDIRLDGVRREDDLLILTVTQAKDPLAGSLLLVFDTDGATVKGLNRWRVIDAQGQITEVSLHGATTGIALKNSLFHYYDPARGEPTFN